MKKQLTILFFLAIFIALNIYSPAIFAAYYENAKADAIFKKLDLADYKTQLEGENLLIQFKQIIAADDEIRQKLYIRLNCWNQPSTTDTELANAIKYAEQQILIYSEPYPSTIHTDLLLCLGYYKQFSGQLDEALEDLSNAINSAYELEDPRLIADGRSIRGSMLSYQGNYASALEDLITSQQLYENLNLTYWANDNLSELAASYRRFGDAETALKYQIKLEKMYLKANQLIEADNINNQIAFSLLELGRIEESTARFKQSLTFWKTQKDNIAIADAKTNIAGNLIKLDKIDEALVLLKEAEKEVPVSNDGPHSSLMLYLAQAYLAKNELDKALEYSQLASIDFNRGGNQRGESENIYLKSDIYQAKGDIENALITLQQFLKMHMALDKQNMSDRNSEMQARFDTNKIQTENEWLVQRDQDKEQQLQILQRNENMQIIIIILVAIILMIVSIFAYKQVMRKQLFRRLALTDELTKLSNRRDTYSQGNYFLKSSQQSGKPFSIISFDADHFKIVNDTLGHEMGDKVLVKLASISTSMMRDTDVVGRVGGEEFLILLPNIDKAKAIEIANRLIETIADYDWTQISPTLHQTISAGVASYSNETELSPLLLKADKALYSAKAAGRNCVKAE
ncbi:diguanylate cyclase [Shewanella sp. SG41-4]|uniref:tetratricopeptide repeat-containing diguanylate cyclase n=1 Tax=Shewanella sp. SG41-4 TaxID=2760976 RepID=UPI0016031638|nr:GGDEF domain-containing protein [Shewanella sp. SG41-4]MBB1438229.1 diguanylate cyclase [Shewanella sp. SG41-4]